MIKKFGAAALVSSLLIGGIVSTKEAKVEANNPNNAEIKNVIFMVPDGYSSSYATGYRWYKGEKTMMDSMLVGMVNTHSADNEVTDSAAAGTAYATGVKTNNGMLSIDPSNGDELKTLVEAAEENGKATGLVVTSSLTDATPGAFGSHLENRNIETAIPPQLLDNDIDVLLGGGKGYFLPKDQGGYQENLNLIEEAKQAGYELVENEEQLKKVKNNKVLGLFSNGGMSAELDRENTKEPSLADMTDKAIETVKKDKDGFFLMVEGSQIDWAAHAHDAARAMKDVEAFEKAVEKAVNFAKKDGHTLVVVAGDHDTSGFSVGAYDQYGFNADVLKNVTATSGAIASSINPDRTNIKEVMKKFTQLNLTDEEVLQIQQAKNVGDEINKVINKRALVGWTSKQHTGVDVPLYAYGPKSQAFSGLKDNTEVSKIIAKALKVELND